MNLFVSELDFQTRRIELRSQFEKKGKVGSESIDIRKGATQGVGSSFVEFSNKNEFLKSMEDLGGATAKRRLHALGTASTSFRGRLAGPRFGFSLGLLACAEA